MLNDLLLTAENVIALYIIILKLNLMVKQIYNHMLVDLIRTFTTFAQKTFQKGYAALIS